MANTEPMIVLVAEDSPDDQMLLGRVLSDLNFVPKFVNDGAEAISYISGFGIFGDRMTYPFPEALILDIKMPRMNGFDVLQWMQDHPLCAIVPTMVFTSSNEPSDIKLAYRLGANTYFQKPSEYRELKILFHKIVDYWCAAEKPKAVLLNVTQAKLTIDR